MDNDDIFLPLDRSAVAEGARLSHYGFHTRTDLRTGNPYAALLLDSEWIGRNGFANVTSKRVHLMYHHLYGSRGQTVRDELGGLGRSEAYTKMLELDWSGDGLETVMEAIDDEKKQCETLLGVKFPAGRIPLFRGVHCMSPTDAAGGTALQQWTARIIRKGVLDETVQLDEVSNDPTGYVCSVAPFTSTVDSWTCSYKGAKYWSQTRLPGSETCMVMAASVAHEAVVLWRNDSPGMDEILVLGGSGAVNVYFQPQIKDKASPAEVASW